MSRFSVKQIVAPSSMDFFAARGQPSNGNANGPIETAFVKITKRRQASRAICQKSEFLIMFYRFGR